VRVRRCRVKSSPVQLAWIRGKSLRPAERESGVYAVVAVLLTTLLLGISALAVDLANARMIRTQAQNTVDSAALAAAQDLPDTVKVLATVKAYALDNFKLPASAWAGCTDEGALALVIDTDTTNRCITTDATRTHLRVRLPITKMKTAFGRTIGVENVAIRATAEVEATPGMDSRMFPTAIMQTDGDGLECLENGGASTPCGPTHSGTFGSIESPRLNIHKTSSSADVLRLNFAMGIDHGLTTDSVLPKVCDGTAITSGAFTCVGNISDPSLLANHLDMEPGGAINTVTDGMVDGGSITTSDPTSSSKPFCGRLTRPDRTTANISVLKPGGTCTPTPPTISVSGMTVNGHHIVMWLTPAARTYFYPTVVGNPVLTDASYAAGDARLKCFLDYYNPVTHLAVPPSPATAACPVTPVGLGVPIFQSGIVNDIRYGTIPIICQVLLVPCTRPGPSSIGAIKQFKAAFIYKLYENGGGKVQAFNGWVFDLWLIDPGSTPLGASTTPIVHLSK
jgi:Flp pilus assembly protein TadG